LFTIDLPDKNITLFALIALFTICIILHTFDAKVAISILHFACLISLSKFSHISFSETDTHFLFAHRLSHIYKFTHSAHILAIFAKSAGLSIAGV
jgi:hypothetical protein